MSDKAFFDTNIIVYAHDAAFPGKCQRSRELLFKHIRQGTGVISSQVLSEFFVTVTKKVGNPLSPEQARKEMLLLASMATVDVDATLVIRAVEISIRWQTSYWDGLILAAAERAECKTVFSEDLADGQTYGSVTVVNPFNEE